MATSFKGPILNKEANSGNRQWYAKQPMNMDDPDYFKYFNDFIAEQDYAAADWVITTTEAGTGNASEAIAADEKGGALLITNDDADNDSDSLQLTQETFSLTSDKRCWYETRIKTSDATQTDIFMGLNITDTSPLDTTDRVGFQKNDGDTNILAKTEKDSTETSTDTGSDMADATYVQLGFYWDGKNKVEFYVDRDLKATHTTNIPDDENLAVTIHIVNGEAAAKTLTIDYIRVIQER